MPAIDHCGPAKPLLLLLVLLTVTIPSQVNAEHQFLWEGGGGLGMVNAPFYRGSAQTKLYSVPIPFIRFRGRIFSADEDGMRGKLADSGRATLDISIAGNVPVPKSDNGARKDMPSLDPLAEMGPAFQYRLWRNPDQSRSWNLELPLRAVISVGNPILDHQGWSLAPFIQYTAKKRTDGVLWRYTLSTGPLFADQQYHNYFYQVEAPHATAARREYNPSGGYSGSRVSFGMSRNGRHSFFGFFARYDDLHGARFLDSPLVEQSHYLVYGIAAVWIFAQSDQQAPHYWEQ